MATVTLMNWNVQNYGPTKSGVNYNNYDVVEAIAKEVADAGVDIFCMLEVNTTSNATAAQVCAIMGTALKDYAASQGRQEWKTCVISPNTGKEFYAFFVRDTAFTKPMPVTGPVGTFGPPDYLGPATFWTPVTNAVFTGTTFGGVPANRFPLLVPDRERLSYKGRSLGTPIWPGTRYPVLALFHVPSAAAANQLLPIFACHFSPDADVARNQIATLKYFSVLWKLSAGNGPPVQLQIDPNGTGATATAMNYSITLGDFNVDYVSANGGYAPLEGTGAGQLGATAADLNVNTHLVTYANYTRTMKTTDDLAVNLYDNLFTRVNAATASPVTAAAADVYNVPEDVRNRRLELNASVQHYAELDQRGFQGSNAYQDFVTDYARQIAGDPSHLITVKGSLVGGRLISDHLPVTMQLTI